MTVITTPDGKWNITVDITAVVAPPPPPPPPPPIDPTAMPMSVGTNLAAPSYSGQGREFSNLFTTGRTLITAAGKWISVPDTIVDSNNDVVTLAAGERIALPLTPPSEVLAGTPVDVVCRWQGTTSKVAFFGSTATNVKIDMAARTATLTIVPGASAPTFIYTGTDPADPFRAFDCREVSADPKATFDPTFLANAKQFSTLRFMDWAQINNNYAITWATRNTPNKAVIRAFDGVALEYMIELANLTGKNPWFNVPWNADITYLQGMATLIRDTLDPKLKAHIEVANEVWNYKFPVTQQAQIEGEAAGFGTGKPLSAILRYSQKITEVMPVFEQVFAGQTHRLVRVGGSQNSSYTIDQMLKYPGLVSHIDAVAVAPYFGGSMTAGALATQALIDAELDTNLPTKLATVFSITRQNKAIVTKVGLRFIAYEGGQHVISPEVGQNRLMQNDPRMGSLYNTYLSEWSKLGDTVVLFTNVGKVSQFGAWGLTEYFGQTPMTPKAAAVDAFIKTLP